MSTPLHTHHSTPHLTLPSWRLLPLRACRRCTRGRSAALMLIRASSRSSPVSKPMNWADDIDDDGACLFSPPFVPAPALTPLLAVRSLQLNSAAQGKRTRRRQGRRAAGAHGQGGGGRHQCDHRVQHEPGGQDGQGELACCKHGVRWRREREMWQVEERGRERTEEVERWRSAGPRGHQSGWRDEQSAEARQGVPASAHVKAGCCRYSVQKGACRAARWGRVLSGRQRGTRRREAAGRENVTSK